MPPPTIGVLVGSVRRESVNQQLATALGHLGRPGLDFEAITIDTLPMYNDDLWEDPPAAVTHMKSRLLAVDAILLVTPEYNRSVPPLLKNAIDWGARPKGQGVWVGKPLAIVGASIGVIGTAVAQAHLRSVMLALEAIVMGQPEVYLAYRPGLFDTEGQVTDPAVATFLRNFLEKFDAWIHRVGVTPAGGPPLRGSR